MRYKTLSVVLWLLCTTVAHAHPFHTSLTELEYSAQNKTIEIAIKLTIVDLETELSSLLAKNIVMDGNPENDALILDYIQSHFRLTPVHSIGIEQAGDHAILQWVGKQLEISHMWVYLTASVDEAKQVTLDNRLLLKNASEQINTVVVLNDGKREAHHLTTADTTLTVGL